MITIGDMRTINSIGEAAMLEQLAEECAELGKAALKLARIDRGENPTPIKREEALKELTEEAADVSLVIDALSYSASCSPLSMSEIEQIKEIKTRRWVARIEAGKE